VARLLVTAHQASTGRPGNPQQASTVEVGAGSGAAGCFISDFDGNAVHTGPGIIAARDRDSHATLMDLIARHRTR
jgi:hypothetical protein